MNKNAPIVITGAAGGIGQATIRALASTERSLHLIDPNKAALDEAMALASGLGLTATTPCIVHGKPRCVCCGTAVRHR